MTTKDQRWHLAPTMAGKPAGRVHYDIGDADGASIAQVLPSDDGDLDTLKKARLIAAAPLLLRIFLEVYRGVETGRITMDERTEELLADAMLKERDK